jgi:sigma-54 dependent transcriptional regulator, acetoin dehydrogenase operon transcriptional activator AcoR
LPPLRQRLEDIPLLAAHFVSRQNTLTGKDIQGLSPEVLGLLMRHFFPGNVRELENIIEYAFILCPGGRAERIRLEHLPEGLTSGLARREGPQADGPQEDGDASPACGTLAMIKRRAATDALARNNGRVMAACRELGISKDTLRRILGRVAVSRLS